MTKDKLNLNSRESTGSESLSHVIGFDLDSSKQYLLDIGYSKMLVANLERSPTISSIPFPKHLDPSLKSTYKDFFEREILARKNRSEHVLVFFALTAAKYLTEMVDDGKNPFRADADLARTLPLNALPSLAHHKFKYVLEFLMNFRGVELNKFCGERVYFASTGSRSVSNVRVEGDIKLKLLPKVEMMAVIASLAKRGIYANGVPFKVGASGISAAVFVEGGDLVVAYRISFSPKFRHFAKTNFNNWITRYAVKPNLRLGHSVKVKMRGGVV